ncbi:MAG: nucleotidyltransferase family protein [Candidatus Saccharibacteria bacterium]
MKKYQEKLIRLLQLALHPGEKNDLEITKGDWPDLFSLIIQQGLVSVIYPVIDSIDDDKQPENALKQNWKYNFLSNATIQVQRIKQIHSIIDSFNSAGVSVIVIKGPAIARFYASPECRSMSDLDLLVQDNSSLKAQQTIEAMGYRLYVNEDRALHQGYSKAGHLNVELHYSLLETDILGPRDMSNWYTHIWSHRKSITFEDMVFSIMSEEDELINQILHMATHMFHGGVRMRHLYDIALLIKHSGPQLDWGYIEDTMRNIRMLEFGKLVFTTSHDYFGVEIPARLHATKGISSEQFIDSFMNEYCVDKPSGHQRVWRRLAIKMPFLCRSLITLPIVYVLEYWVQLTRHKRNPCSSLVATHYNMKIFTDRVRTLKMLGMNE